MSTYRLTKVWLPAGIVAVAMVLRLWAIDRLPPGLYTDEAADGIDALRVLDGVHPIFFTGNQGREPLSIYLQAVAIWLVGPTPLALRLPAVALGILTVAATYATFRGLFGRRVGLLGAFLLATSFWHLDLSRLGFRTASMPLFATLAAFWLWHGIRSGRLRDFALAGLFLAVDMYTYIPARLIPAILGLWFLGVLIGRWIRRDSSSKGAEWQQLLLGGAVAFICFLISVFPLADYFWLHPADFWQRLNAAGNLQMAASAPSGFVEAAQGLFWTGDPNPRQDLPGLPLIAMPLSALGVIGLAVSVRRRDAPAVLIIIWCLAMLAPAALSFEPAHGLRLAGELPFILAFPALGLDWLLGLPSASARRAGIVIVTAVLTFVAIATPWDYFVEWGRNPATFEAFQFDALDALRLIAAVPAGHTIFASTYDYEGQSIPLSFDPTAAARSRAFDGRLNFVYPSNTSNGVYYIYPRSLMPESYSPMAERLAPIATVSDPFGVVDGQLFILRDTSQIPQPRRPANAIIASTVHLVGSDVTPVVQPGGHVHFVLWWNILRPPPASAWASGGVAPGGVANWEFFAHLVTRDGHKLITDNYNHGFPLRQWRTGDHVISWFDLSVPNNAPAGVADVDAGILDHQTGQRLPLTDPSGHPAGDELIVGPVRIDRPRVVPPPAHPLDDLFGQSIHLLGYDLVATSPGHLNVRLHWQTTSPISKDYTVFVHLLDTTGHLVAQDDHQPGAGAFPTSTWNVGETILDPHQIELPSTSARPARVEIGVYLLSTGQRLPVYAANGARLGDVVTFAVNHGTF